MSVVAPAGLVDLTLPAAVSVAEVSAELAVRLGLDRGLCLQTVLGARLSPQGTVGAQITDGSVLQVVEAIPRHVPKVHDDAADAIRDSLAGVDPHWDVICRIAGAGGCVLALAVGVMAVLLTALEQSAMGGSLERALVGLLLSVGALVIALPRLSLFFARIDSDLCELGTSGVRAAVKRGHAALLRGTALVGLVLVVLVPAGTTTGLAGTVLAANVTVDFLLSSRSLPRWPMVCATLMLGSLALFLGLLAAMTVHPDWRMPIASAAVLLAAALALFGAFPERIGVRIAWLGEGATWLTRFMLLPLGVWALGLLSWPVGSRLW